MVHEGLWIPAFAGKTVKPQPIITVQLSYQPSIQRCKTASYRITSDARA